jgi:hypothetical protein
MDSISAPEAEFERSLTGPFHHWRGVIHVGKSVELDPHVMDNLVSLLLRELAGSRLSDDRAENLRDSEGCARHKRILVHPGVDPLTPLFLDVPLHPGTGVEIVDRHGKRLPVTITDEQLGHRDSRRFDWVYSSERAIRGGHPERLRRTLRHIGLFISFPLQKSPHFLFERRSLLLSAPTEASEYGIVDIREMKLSHDIGESRGETICAFRRCGGAFRFTLPAPPLPRAAKMTPSPP